MLGWFASKLAPASSDDRLGDAEAVFAENSTKNYMSPEQLFMLVQKYGAAVTLDSVKALFADIDEDGSGGISLEEFEKFWAKSKEVGIQVVINKVVWSPEDAFDDATKVSSPENGDLNFQRFMSLLQSQGFLLDDATPEFFLFVFRCADTDHSDHICKSEFIQWAKDYDVPKRGLLVFQEMFEDMASHYEVELKRLGFNDISMLSKKSGQAVVYRALFEGKDVAVKVFKDVKNVQQFKKEIRALMRADHPNLVRVEDFFDSPMPCIVMPFISGKTLFDFLQGRNMSRRDSMEQIGIAQLRDDEAIAILIGVASGLTHLHERNLVHRDLKSENIMINGITGAPVIIDLGLGSECMSDELRQTLCLQGTLPYMTPEMLRSQSFSPKSDVYAFGILMWEVFSSLEPNANCKGLSVDDFSRKILVDGMRPNPVDCGNRPSWALELMQRCWAAEPEERPTMKVVFDQLEHSGANGPSGRVRSPTHPLSGTQVPQSGAFSFRGKGGNSSQSIVSPKCPPPIVSLGGKTTVGSNNNNNNKQSIVAPKCPPPIVSLGGQAKAGSSNNSNSNHSNQFAPAAASLTKVKGSPTKVVPGKGNPAKVVPVRGRVEAELTEASIHDEWRVSIRKAGVSDKEFDENPKIREACLNSILAVVSPPPPPPPPGQPSLPTEPNPQNRFSASMLMKGKERLQRSEAAQRAPNPTEGAKLTAVLMESLKNIRLAHVPTDAGNEEDTNEFL